MKRDEAVTLLREISSGCHNLSPESILLVETRRDDQQSVGYQLHIRMALDGQAVQEIRAIALKNRYAVHEEKGEAIIIYRPKP